MRRSRLKNIKKTLKNWKLTGFGTSSVFTGTSRCNLVKSVFILFPFNESKCYMNWTPDKNMCFNILQVLLPALDRPLDSLRNKTLLVKSGHLVQGQQCLECSYCVVVIFTVVWISQKYSNDDLQFFTVSHNVKTRILFQKSILNNFWTQK